MFASRARYYILANISQEYIPMLRYSFGATLLMAVSMAFAWNMAYLTPVLALSFIAPGTTVPSLKNGLSFVCIIVITTLLGFVFTRFFIHMKLVFIPIHTLVLFLIFYTDKLPATIKTFMIIGLLVMPLLGMQSMNIAFGFLKTFASGSFITICIVWFIFALFPDKESSSSIEKKKASDSNSPEERYNKAIQTSFVVIPAILVFFIFQWIGGLLVLIFITLFSMQGNFNMKAGAAMIIGNLVGGIVSIFAFEILTMAPIFSMLVLITLMVSLICASKLFSKEKIAPLFGMGFSTFLLITGQALTSTDNAGEKVWIRVLQIMLAVTYVIVSFAISNAFRTYRKTKLRS